MKRGLWIALSLAATLAAGAMIFSFSAQVAEESSRMSDLAVFFIARIFRVKAPEAAQAGQLKIWVPVVRKLAHMGEFALLGACLSLFLHSLRAERDLKRTALLAWAIGTAYGATDELHQLFVDGRSGMFLDVCVDSAGAALGALLIALIAAAWRGRRAQKTDER